MGETDPLEAWRSIIESEWERIDNNERCGYPYETHTAERLEQEEKLLAAWENERGKPGELHGVDWLCPWCKGKLRVIPEAWTKAKGESDDRNRIAAD